jgi:hypothetical protein
MTVLKSLKIGRAKAKVQIHQRSKAPVSIKILPAEIPEDKKLYPPQM